MAVVTMAEARMVGSEGQEQIVRLPGTPGNDQTVPYDPLAHRGALKCRFCDAAVHYNAGSETICGQTDLKGPSPHFHTNPGQTHDSSCLWKFFVNEQRPAASYDDRKGFRIHLNTGGYSALFAAKAGPYERGADNKLMVRDPSLRPMRPVSIDSAAAVADFIRQGQFERLRASRVLHNGWDLPWERFFVRYDRGGESGQKRFAGLVQRLKSGEPQPCLMEFNIAAGVTPRPYEDIPPVRSAMAALPADRQGNPQQVFPRAYLNGRLDTRVTYGFCTPGSYLVMGYARLNTHQDERGIRHILAISVTDPAQIIPVRLEDLAKAGREKAARRSDTAIAAKPAPE